MPAPPSWVGWAFPALPDAESLKTLESLPGKSGALLLGGDQGDIGGGMFVIGEGGLAAVGDRGKRNSRLGPPAPQIKKGR